MADTKTEFDHKGIEIYITSTGRFYADTTNGRMSAPSVAGLRKKIDKVSQFKPFKAFLLEGWRDDNRLAEITVTGIEHRKRYGGLMFKTDRGGSHREVYEDTPTNRAIAKKYIEAANRFHKIEKKHEADQKKLEDRITVRTPDPKEL